MNTIHDGCMIIIVRNAVAVENAVMLAILTRLLRSKNKPAENASFHLFSKFETELQRRWKRLNFVRKHKPSSFHAIASPFLPVSL